MAVIEMLLVGVIVLVAAAYSTWALLPATGRRKAATRLLPLAANPACPGWLARRIRSAATAPGTGSPCDACSGGRPRNDETP